MKTVTSIVLNNFQNDSRVLKENISLKKAGYQVVVVALHEEPLREHEVVHGLPVHRIKLKSRSWPKNKAIQLLKYCEFAYRVIKQYKYSEILHCNDMNSLPIGSLIKIFSNSNIKIVYDAHEYEINSTPNESRYRIKINHLLEGFFIKYADRVITVSNSIANEYVKLYQIEKPSLVLNTPPYVKAKQYNLFRENLGIGQDQSIFVYQGGLTEGRGIEKVIDAFRRIGIENNRSKDSPVVVFLGYGPLEEKIKLFANRCDNIYFHKAVPPNVLINYTSSADFGIAIIEDTCLSYRYCLPNKLFECLMAEIPIIVSNLPEMKDIVESNNVGLAVSNTPENLIEAIKKIENLEKSTLIENIRKVNVVYNWEKQEVVLFDLYRSLY